MFNYVCRRTSFSHSGAFLEFPPCNSRYLCSLSSSPTTIICSNSSKSHSLTVSYLMRSCGLPPEKAILASKYVNIISTQKADSVLAVFKNHGFTETQISNLIRKCPRVLLLDPNRKLLPKLEFVRSIGLSSTELARVISASPCILTCSLEMQIIPSYKAFRKLFQSDEETVVAFKRFPHILTYRNQSYPTDNIQILGEAGVPESNIKYFLSYHPGSFITNPNDFRRIVEEVVEMGFSPLKKHFIYAVQALKQMSKSTWEKKVQVYEKWGLSKDEILEAFRKNPGCMIKSEDKITRVMDFLVNSLGLKPSVITNASVLISYSLEKRLYPRFLVYQVLLEKGLMKKNYSLVNLISLTENEFLNRMKKYEEEAPELLKLYQKSK